MVETEIRRLIDAKLQEDEQSDEADVEEEEKDSGGGKTHQLWYQNQMSTAYKKEEKTLKDTVRCNCVPTRQNEKIEL